MSTQISDIDRNIKIFKQKVLKNTKSEIFFVEIDLELVSEEISLQKLDFRQSGDDDEEDFL